MSQVPSMPLFVDAYLADTTHLSTEEHGAYLLLLMAMWRRGGTVPDDDRDNARMVGLSPRKWKSVKARLLRLLTAENGELSQKRLQKEFKYVTKLSETRRQNGKMGGRPKSNENNDITKANGKANGKQTKSTHTHTQVREEIRRAVSWDEVSPNDPVLQRPDDVYAEYSEEEIALLIIEYPLLDIHSELEELWNWAWSKGIIKDNERKRAIAGALKSKHQKLEAARPLVESMNSPTAPVSSEALAALKARRKY